MVTTKGVVADTAVQESIKYTIYLWSTSKCRVLLTLKIRSSDDGSKAQEGG